ncbi:MAG: hypothetical protein SGILL_001218 [Bacillariaceae sp.]
MKTASLHILSALALLCSVFTPSGGQEIGVEICHCAPNTYEFTLDFALFCPPVNITIGDAVQATTCMVSPFGDPSVTDLIPVAVQSIDVLELNQNLQVMMQENIAGNFGDGETFQYTSYAAIPGEIVNPEDLPRALQININGVNQFDESIINSDLGPPSREFCPLVASDAPTVGPDSPAPSPSPSEMPTGAPVTTPTPPPTSIPMSMSMSMSMDLRFGDLFDTMNDINDMAREFGRNPIVMDKVGIRGSRVQPRPRAAKQPSRTRQKTDVECDDYPCAATNSAEVESGSSPKSAKLISDSKDMKVKSGKSDKSGKMDKAKGPKGAKDEKAKEGKSAKEGKAEKKDKTHTKKDTDKLTKGENKRRLSPLYDTFGREEHDEEERYTYGAQR